MTELIVPHPIPYVCQFASPDLVQEFVNGGRDLLTDPRWAEYGADAPDEYVHWSLRACGVVCIKMVVEGITGCEARPVMAWVRDGLARDGYLTEIRADRPDKPVEKGWKHASLAQLARDFGCTAELVTALKADDLKRYVSDGQVIVTSVTSQLGENGEITRQSGHLVLVYGVVVDDHQQITHVIIHNPSGRTPDMQAGARIPIDRFMSGFSGRGIVIGAAR